MNVAAFITIGKAGDVSFGIAPGKTEMAWLAENEAAACFDFELLKRCALAIAEKPVPSLSMTCWSSSAAGKSAQA